MNSAEKEIVNETHSVENFISFVWKINNFSTSPLMFHESLRSENFRFLDGTFCLEGEYRPFSDASSSTKDVNFSVKVKCLTPTAEKLVCSFSIKRTWSHKTESEMYNPKCSQILPLSLESSSVHLFSETQLQTVGSSFYRNDCVIIFCKLMKVCIKQDLDIQVVSSNSEGLSRDLGNLLDSGVNSDVKLVVGDQTFQAHSGVLSARSPVFATMLQRDAEDCHPLEINVSDCTATAMAWFLRYLYTGDSSSLNPNPKHYGIQDNGLLDVYATAIKYDVAELRDMCSKCVAFKLSESNSTKYAMWAKEHEDQNIMNLVVRFCARKKNIVGTDAWNGLLTIIPNLAHRVLNEIVHGKTEFPYVFGF